MQQTSWREKLKEIISSSDRGLEALRDLANWLSDNVVANDVIPREMPEPVRKLLHTLGQGLDKSLSNARVIDESVAMGPAVKLTWGHLLTREEYYLLLARLSVDGGALTTGKDLGLSSFNDFEIFSLLHYDNDQKQGYVDFGPPRATRKKGTAFFGTPPEEIPLGCLRPEQKEFFQRNLPEIFARFKRN